MKTLKKILKIAFFGAVLCITLIAALVTIENWRGKRAWESRVAEMKAKGEPTTLREMVGPEIPADENFAEFFRPFLPDSKNNELEKRRVESVKALDAEMKEKWDIRAMLPSVIQGRKMALNDLPQISESLSKYDDMINEYVAYAQRPRARFFYDLDKPGFWQGHAYLKYSGCLAYAPSLRAILEIEKNNPKKAYEFTLAGFQVVNHFQSEVFLTVFLSNQAFFYAAIEPYWVGLEKHIWTDDELKQFAAILDQINFLRGHVRTFQTEKLFAFDFLKEDFFGSDGKSLRMRVFDMTMSTTPKQHPFLALLVWMAPKAFLYQNSVQITRYYNDLIYDQEIMEGRAPYSRHPMIKDELYVKKISTMRNPYKFVTAMSAPSAARSLKRAFISQVIVDEALVSVYLERYYLKHKEYPESLEQLVPEYVAAVPVDRYDGKPLRYQRLGKASYRLYSVGPNLKDDGGVRGQDKKTHADGDLVWEVGVN